MNRNHQNSRSNGNRNPLVGLGNALMRFASVSTAKHQGLPGVDHDGRHNPLRWTPVV